MIFSETALKSAQRARNKLFDTYLELRSGGKGSLKSSKIGDKYFEQFTNEINDDLNLPKAIATTWAVINDKKVPDKEKLYLLLRFDNIFGFNLRKLKSKSIPFRIKRLAEKRLKARLKKDFQTADKLRQMLKAKGYGIEDTIKSYILKRK
jgi:cysteinyl-tRNA synthetase